MAEIQIKIIVPGSDSTVQTGGSESAAGPPPETLERIESVRLTEGADPAPAMLEGASGFVSSEPPAPEPLDEVEASGKKGKSGKSKK